MLTYLYVRCALGQGSRSSLAKFSSFKTTNGQRDIRFYLRKIFLL